MAVWRMPGAEVAIDIPLVRALLREQHADLAALPLTEAGEGWDNRLFRLGGDLVVRLPRRQAAAALIEHEHRWLPELAPRLPLPVPAPVRIGRPAHGYPWSWGIAPWFAGRSAATGSYDAGEVAVQLGRFVAALHQPAPAGAPANPFRTSLALRHDTFTESVGRLGSHIDGARARAAWDAVLAVPDWARPPVWLHGDLHPGNLLIHRSRLSAVIDFGDLTAGDPSVDLAVAWMMLPPASRLSFRQTAGAAGAGIDDDTWRRARGWALSLGVAYLANSIDNEVMGRLGRETIAAALADEE